MQSLKDKVGEIETEMRRIGFWSFGAAPATDDSKPYSGVSFEEWLQFVFLPKVTKAIEERDFSQVPPYRIGLAALRQYNYHSTILEARHLMSLCHDLESLLGGQPSQ